MGGYNYQFRLDIKELLSNPLIYLSNNSLIKICKLNINYVNVTSLNINYESIYKYKVL